MRQSLAPLLSFLLFTVFTPPLLGQGPCGPESRQFDFWIGEWQLTWSDTAHGTNVISKPFDSCVILENFDSGEYGYFKGMSVSTYNVRTGKWQQTWVDNAGGYLDFEGGLVGDSMVLSREATGKDGKVFLQRMVWYNIDSDSFDWNWERSVDGGENWEVLWQIAYERVK